MIVPLEIGDERVKRQAIGHGRIQVVVVLVLLRYESAI
jgi:hypothetical protein